MPHPEAPWVRDFSAIDKILGPFSFDDRGMSRRDTKTPKSNFVRAVPTFRIAPPPNADSANQSGASLRRLSQLLANRGRSRRTPLIVTPRALAPSPDSLNLMSYAPLKSCHRPLLRGPRFVPPKVHLTARLTASAHPCCVCRIAAHEIAGIARRGRPLGSSAGSGEQLRRNPMELPPSASILPRVSAPETLHLAGFVRRHIQISAPSGSPGE